MTLGEGSFAAETVADTPAPRRFSMTLIAKRIVIQTIRMSTKVRLAITAAAKLVPDR